MDSDIESTAQLCVWSEIDRFRIVNNRLTLFSISSIENEWTEIEVHREGRRKSRSIWVFVHSHEKKISERRICNRIVINWVGFLLLLLLCFSY